MLHSRTITWLACCILLSVATRWDNSIASAEEPNDERKGLKFYEAEGSVPLQPQGRHAGNSRYEVIINATVDPKVKHVHFHISHTVTLSPKIYASGSIAIPKLKRGDVVPMLGSLYRVELIGKREVWLEPADLSLLPEQAAPPPWDNMVVPLNGHVSGGDRHAVLASIIHDKAAGEWIAQFDEIDFIPVVKSPEFQKRNTLTDPVRVGKVYKVNSRLDLYFRLERIVPPDPKNDILGWVEFKPFYGEDSVVFKGMKAGRSKRKVQ